MLCDGASRYGLELVQAAGVVGYASDVTKPASSSSSTSGGDNPFDTGPGGINQPAADKSTNSNIAPGFDASAATCLLTSMFRDDFANVIASCAAVNMCGRSLVGQCLHNLSIPRAQFDRCAAIAAASSASVNSLQSRDTLQVRRQVLRLRFHEYAVSVPGARSLRSDVVAPSRLA